MESVSEEPLGNCKEEQSLDAIVKKEKPDQALETAINDEIPEDFFDDLLDAQGKANADAAAVVKSEVPEEVVVKTELPVDNHLSRNKETLGESSALEENLPQSSNNAAAAAPLAIVKSEKASEAENVKASSPPPPRLTIRLKKESDLLLPVQSSPTDSMVQGDGHGVSVENDNIPEDFFDDFVEDKLQQHFEEENVRDLETKYSEKLKILKSLEEGKKDKKKNKKHKKNKKKSKHGDNEIAENCIDGKDEKKRRRTRSETASDCELPTSSKKSKFINSVPVPKEFRSVKPSVFVKPEIGSMSSMSCPPENSKTFKTTHIEEHPFFGKAHCKKEEDQDDEDVLSLDEKMIRALQIITPLREQLKNKNRKWLPLFQFTNTVRQLPRSTNMYLRKDYEDRSPLNSVNNVEYCFNTNRTEINIFEYGLERIPKTLAEPARLVGLDVHTLYNKMVNIKIPPTVRLNRIRPSTLPLISDEVEISGSTMFRNKSIQTDCSIFKGNSNSQSVGTQMKPQAFSIGLQTNESGSSNFEMSNTLPLFKLVKGMSEQQLFALHDFAEILLEPPSTNSIDIYQVRQRLLEIYKLSQQPSKLQRNIPQNLLQPGHNPNLNLRISEPWSTGEQRTTNRESYTRSASNVNVNDPRLRLHDYNQTSSIPKNRNFSESSSNTSSHRWH